MQRHKISCFIPAMPKEIHYSTCWLLYKCNNSVAPKCLTAGYYISFGDLFHSFGYPVLSCYRTFGCDINTVVLLLYLHPQVCVCFSHVGWEGRM